MTRQNNQVLRSRFALRSELFPQRVGEADIEYLIASWTFVLKLREARRESLTDEQADCLEGAAQNVARFLNLIESRRFQQHLARLPEDFPLVM